MSVALHQRMLHESGGAAPALPRGLRLPWRDSASQQLDALEAANRQLSSNRIGSRGLWVGAVAAALLLVAMTSSWQPGRALPVSGASPAGASPLLPLPVTTEQSQPLSIAQPAPERVLVPDAAALAAISEAAQQQAARARSLAEARRQAARVAQERALAGKDALRASEQARPPERVVAVTAPAHVAEPPATVLQPVVHAAPRADVKDLCSGAGFFGQPICQARECRKPEHSGDAVCVRLREFEQARARGADH